MSAAKDRSTAPRVQPWMITLGLVLGAAVLGVGFSSDSGPWRYSRWGVASFVASLAPIAAALSAGAAASAAQNRRQSGLAAVELASPRAALAFVRGGALPVAIGLSFFVAAYVASSLAGRDAGVDGMAPVVGLVVPVAATVVGWIAGAIIGDRLDTRLATPAAVAGVFMLWSAAGQSGLSETFQFGGPGATPYSEPDAVAVFARSAGFALLGLGVYLLHARRRLVALLPVVVAGLVLAHWTVDYRPASPEWACSQGAVEVCVLTEHRGALSRVSGEVEQAAAMAREAGLAVRPTRFVELAGIAPARWKGALSLQNVLAGGGLQEAVVSVIAPAACLENVDPRPATLLVPVVDGVMGPDRAAHRAEIRRAHEAFEVACARATAS